MVTLIEFATKERIRSLLIKERVKCCKKNKQHKVVFRGGDDENDDVVYIRRALSLMMPPRNKWCRPQSRKKYLMADTKMDTKKLNAHAISVAIKKDEKASGEGRKPSYLTRLDEYIETIQNILKGEKSVVFNKPVVDPQFKSKETKKNGHLAITYRPVSMYTNLQDKIIQAVTAKYLTYLIEKELHENILSYRSPRKFHGEATRRVTNFNDGIMLIKEYREKYAKQDIYVADCDIQKFFDTINHDVMCDCFRNILTKAGLDEGGIEQVMRIMRAYIDSFNFTDNVLLPSTEEYFWNKQQKKFKDEKGENTYQFKWINEERMARECYGDKDTLEKEKRKIGVPQGGSLSTLIANIVLNDVDREAFGESIDEDEEFLLVRFCDDMIIMHTNKKKLSHLAKSYSKSLKNHKFLDHPAGSVEKINDIYTSKAFWNQKSHKPFLWGRGPGEASEWIGFLGYELSRDGRIRLRNSNIEKLEKQVRSNKHARERLIEKYLKEISAQKKTPRQLSERLVKKVKRMSDIFTKSLNFYEHLESNCAMNKQLRRLNAYRNVSLNFTIRKLKYLFGSLEESNEDASISKEDQNLIISGLAEQFKESLRANV